MYSRRCIATTLTTVLVIDLLVLLIANSVNLLVFDIIGAQENSTDTIIENKTGTRSVLRSTQSQGYALANQITVTTDKQTYEPGEIVNITIKNVGTQPIHFSGVNSDIKITNQESGKSFIPSPLLLKPHLLTNRCVIRRNYGRRQEVSGRAGAKSQGMLGFLHVVDAC